MNSEPHTERRDSERRVDSLPAIMLKMLGSPVSIIVLLGGLMLTTINTVQRADHSVQQADYDYDRKMESILLGQSLDSIKNSIVNVNYTILDIKEAQRAEHARTDSILRFIRHTVCRNDPDACP